MNRSKSLDYEEESKELMLVITGFLIRYGSMSSDIRFIQWRDMDDDVRTDSKAHNAVPILIIILDENLQKLQNTNHEIWNDLLELIEILGYEQEVHAERYITIFKQVGNLYLLK